MCAARDPVALYYAHDYAHARARMFGGINFGDLVKNSPIRQIKIPAKVSGYTVYTFTGGCSSQHHSTQLSDTSRLPSVAKVPYMICKWKSYVDAERTWDKICRFLERNSFHHTCM